MGSTAGGLACPFDVPRAEPNAFWESVTRLRASTLCLLNNQAYRGHCILIYDPRHVVRPDQLTPVEWGTFCLDLHACVSALMAVCKPDHINVECLGNQMPHLHWHVIPRYKTDPRWSGPVWTSATGEMHVAELPVDERRALIGALREELAAMGACAEA